MDVIREINILTNILYIKCLWELDRLYLLLLFNNIKIILHTKTEELNSIYADQLQISNEIQDFISTEITASVRELVGAINRVVSFSRIYNKVPNLSEIKVVLKDLLNLAENHFFPKLGHILVQHPPLWPRLNIFGRTGRASKQLAGYCL